MRYSSQDSDRGLLRVYAFVIIVGTHGDVPYDNIRGNLSIRLSLGQNGSQGVNHVPLQT